MLICKTHTLTYLYTLTHPQTNMHTYSLTPKTWSRTTKSTPSLMHMDQFSSVQSFSHVWRFATPWTAAPQANLSIINSRSLLKLVSIELVMPSNHLILCRPLLLPHSVFPSIRVFSNELALHIRWPEYWSLSFSISPSDEYSGLISFRIDPYLSLDSPKYITSHHVPS